MEGGVRERGVEGSAGGDTFFAREGEDEETGGTEEREEGGEVDARDGEVEGEVGLREGSVAGEREEHGHDEEEDHTETVTRDETVVGVHRREGEEVETELVEFDTDGDRNKPRLA